MRWNCWRGWIARGILDVRVAVPATTAAAPIPATAFDEKAGIIEDKCGDKIAWNEAATGAGWEDNWKSISESTPAGHKLGNGSRKRSTTSPVSGADKCSFIITLDVPVGPEAGPDALPAGG